MADEIAHKRHFLQTFRRWESLFKRADKGDLQAEKWLIADYYKSLGHLSPEGLDALTDELKERCTFFPTIRECLEIMKPKQFDYGNRFYRMRHLAGEQSPLLLASGRSTQPQLADMTDANADANIPE